MNKCIFMGRLTRDPEIRYTQSEKPVAVVNYTLAVDRRYKREGEPSADFINFVAYGTAAEFAEKYFKKGTKLLVTARCQTRMYTNNEGKKVYVTEFITEEQEFAESKRAAGNEPAGDDFMQMPDGEELPFN
jgi:single-strand DNA-binding protein